MPTPQSIGEQNASPRVNLGANPDKDAPLISEALAKTIRFLNQHGLQCRLQDKVKGVLPKVMILAGELVVDPRCHPSDVLHEAGHLAIIPAQYRKTISGDVDKGVEAMLDNIERLGLDPDHPLYRAAIQSSEPEATAWAWAAGKAIGLPDKEIIRNHHYQNRGAELRFALQAGAHAGIHGLKHAGMCELARRGPGSYPEMKCWAQPEIPPTSSPSIGMSM